MPRQKYYSVNSYETLWVSCADIDTHPVFEGLYPNMTPDEFEALLQNMRDRGFNHRYPLLTLLNDYQQRLVVLGGHQRLRAAQKLGLRDIAVNIVQLFMPAEHMDEYVRMALQDNMGRRQALTTEQRKDIARKLITNFPRWSDRAIAGDANLSPTTIGVLRKELSSLDSSMKGVLRVGRDGKIRELPQRYDPPSAEPAEVDPQELRQMITDNPRALAELMRVSSAGAVSDVELAFYSARHDARRDVDREAQQQQVETRQALKDLKREGALEYPGLTNRIFLSDVARNVDRWRTELDSIRDMLRDSTDIDQLRRWATRQALERLGRSVAACVAVLPASYHGTPEETGRQNEVPPTRVSAAEPPALPPEASDA